ncbi:MAG: putative baseplate assembly protein [Iphinoe sp. HA4291-MV1]|jgi:predicted phage baseplate assembly protein|nr:putative baseplate assembly protein [Iphinoe sp. HA4291-MV1]
MAKKPPPIDERTATDIAKQVQNLLQQYVPDWQEFDPDTQKPKGISAALIGVFARYAEIIIQRLNSVPYKNFLAFLDLLGASRLPPQPARVPLLFTLATGTEVDTIVPTGTQVAALPAEGENEPVIFETERELVVTAAQLKSIFVRDPKKDLYANYSDITKYNSEIATVAVEAFQGKDPIDHSFYIASDTLLNSSNLQTLTLFFTLEENLQNPDSRTVEWEICSEYQRLPIPVSSIRDETNNLTTSGTVDFNHFIEVLKKVVPSDKKRWLGCRLQTPISQLSQLPSIRSVTLSANLGGTEQPIEEAFINLLPIDLSKPFFPFSEKPQFGDTLYLANREAFSKSGARVTLHVDLANLADLGIPLPGRETDRKPILEWELWTSGGWVHIGTSTRDDPDALLSQEVKFRDTTKAFTVSGSDQVVEFILPGNPQAKIVNGIESFWLRVRIKSGNYGEEARYERDERTEGYIFIPSSFKPPLINSLKVDYSLTTTEQQPEKIVTHNDFSFQVPSGSFEPFQRITDSQPTLYLGFSLPASRSSFPNSTLSIYFQLADIVYDPVYNPDLKPKNSSSSSQPRFSWEYWSKSNNWEKLQEQDDTQAFTHSGLVELLPPEDFVAKVELLPPEDFFIKPNFNLQEKLYWLRVYKEPNTSEYIVEPQLKKVLLNTTTAIQAVTIRNEILGSSDGTQNQIFRTTRSPILKGEYLEIREPEMPSFEEQESIKKVHGENAISETLDETGRSEEIWVRWSEVPDFYGSQPRDREALLPKAERHYVIDRMTGEIRFGDGVNGLIPPIGIANVRMTQYQTGGGIVGNRAENTIIQLKTTIPYIDSATNPQASTGGADAEIIESLIERAPRTIRHSTRSVTFEDYQDLAMLATPEVARAKCVPLLNLHDNALAIQNPYPQFPKAPGEVSIIIVPRSEDPKPLPSQELIERVRDYLETHAIATAKIWVVGPVYVEVSVTVEIVPISLERASAVKQNVSKVLSDFLHPLTGGLDGLGWTFGRIPHKSDFYALLEAVTGVDYIRSLNVNPDHDDENLPDNIKTIFNTKRFLVYSGRHTINLFYENS